MKLFASLGIVSGMQVLRRHKPLVFIRFHLLLSTLNGNLRLEITVLRLVFIENHPDAGVYPTFVSDKTGFLQYRQITFNGSLRYRQCFRHRLTGNVWICLDCGNDKPLTLSEVCFRHVSDICFRHISDIYTDIAVTLSNDITYCFALNYRHNSASVFLDDGHRHSRSVEFFRDFFEAASPGLNETCFIKCVGDVAVTWIG